MKKKIILGVSIGFTALIVILTIAFFVVGVYFYNLAVDTTTSKEFLMQSEQLGQGDTSGNIFGDKLEEDRAWAETIQVKESVTSFDNLNLNAYFYSNSQANHKYAIVVHGYTSKANDMVSASRRIYNQGFSVLAPDCRGHGESQGDYAGMGWFDRLDMLKWIDLIIAKDAQAEIMLYGISMGGATVMMTSGEQLPSNVKVVVEDCGYTSAEDIFTHQLKQMFKLSKFPIINAASVITKIRAGYTLAEASALEQVAKSKTPTLFIHGDKDEFVPFKMLDILYNAATCPKQKYVVEGAGHGFAASHAGEIYWTTVFDFVGNYITL